jgi:hypothetical protein
MKPHKALPVSPPPLASDLLRGADEIAKFLFGLRGVRRQVYYLVECARLPVFRLGAVLCARRSVLLRWIEMQESRILYTMDAEMERLSGPSQSTTPAQNEATRSRSSALTEAGDCPS